MPVMLWVIILMIVHVSGDVHQDDTAPSNRILYNELSITYDHCRAPQKLNRETWTCECPPSLTKRGDDCVCEGCLFETSDESYVEKKSRDMPEYIAGFLKDLDGDDPGGVSTRMFPKERGERRKLKKIKRIREYAKKIQKKFRSVCETEESVGRRSMILVARSETPFVRFVKSLRRYNKGDVRRLKKIDWNQSRIFSVKKIPSYPVIVRPEVLKKDGATHSDTSVGGVIHGAIHSGDDEAYGLVSNPYGTGSLSMGTGAGGALASAFTGEGFSVSGLKTSGGKAFGMGLIGRKGNRGSSTTSLLIGEGDAIATNSLTKTAAASATAVATKIVATAGSAAYGGATAAASASPGKGNADGSASFGDGIQATANVTGNGQTVAETASVGDEKDDLREFVKRQRESGVGDDVIRGEILRGKPGSKIDDFEDDSDNDWFI